MGIAYLAILYVVIGYVLFNFSTNLRKNGPQFIYKKDRCTLYCEAFKCPHKSHLERFHPCIKAQVKWLHSLPFGYKDANIVVYVFGFSLVVFLLAAYLILPNRHEIR